jgi:hypothetical protein
MEWPLHDLSDECALPWMVDPGGRGVEYDPGSSGFAPPASVVTKLVFSTDCVLDDYSFYQPCLRPVVPLAPTMVGQQGISPNSAQYPSAEVNDGERSKADQEANYDSLWSQQLLFTRALEQCCSLKSKREEICPPGCTEKNK